MESRLRKATTKSEKMTLSYQIAKAVLKSNPGKTTDYAHRASLLASELGEKRMEADAIYLSGEGSLARRNYPDAAGRFNHSWNAARNYGLTEVAVSSMDRLVDIALKQNDTREALKWSREMNTYLKENVGRGVIGGEAGRRMDARLRSLEDENRVLREELNKLTGQSQVLETSYKATEAQLKEIQERAQQELTEKDQTISQISLEKQHFDSLARGAAALVQNLTKEQLASSLIQAQTEKDLQAEKRRAAEIELAKKNLEYIRNLLGLLAVFVIVLALLFYTRYLAKRRTANELTAKNKIIEEEQRRSDDLLLNILPPAIAQELKTRNKVAAQKYEQATVMFVDFTGFTKVAEALSPEDLVEELDHCFSNFDNIISQYRIEKIKTIGDAYLCASGLSDKNDNPSDLVKAALQIQDFLLHLKAERMSKGLPLFEARIGIHTGPVVAGVVGAKKFAYDIWGDTVNIAARMEEACEVGHVNVSENTYWLAKYDFEWVSRGKLAAKNKGMLDMYYVTGLKTY